MVTRRASSSSASGSQDNGCSRAYCPREEGQRPARGLQESVAVGREDSDAARYLLPPLVFACLRSRGQDYQATAGDRDSGMPPSSSPQLPLASSASPVCRPGSGKVAQRPGSTVVGLALATTPRRSR